MQSSGIGLSDLRKNITKSGIFSFFANTRKDDDASSDEDSNLYSSEDENYVSSGHRGIVVFKCHCLKSDRQKILHLHLYSGQIFQYTDGKRKVGFCSDICGTFIRSDFSVVIDMKRNRGVVRKIYVFESQESAVLYQKYIEFRNDIGVAVRSAFDAIDRRGAKLITPQLLRIALKCIDVSTTEDDIKAMLLHNHGNGDFYDFQNFFDLFLETQVCNLRECLLEWLFRSRVCSSAGKINTNSLTADLKLKNSSYNEGENWVNIELTSLAENANVNATLPADEAVPDATVYNDADSIIDLISLLPGENVLSLDKVRWCVQAGKSTDSIPQPCPGCLAITTYRVILLSPRKLGARSIALPNPTHKNYETNNERTDSRVKMKNRQAEDRTVGQHSRFGVPRYFSMTSVPLSAIFRANTAQVRNTFFIIAKDFRVIRIILSCAIASNHCPLVSGRSMNESSDSPSAPPSPALPSLPLPASSTATPVSSSTSTAIDAIFSGASTHIEPCPAVIQKKGDGAHLNAGNESINHGNKSHSLHNNQVECNGSSSAAQIHHHGQGQGHVQGQGQRDGSNDKKVDQLNDNNNLGSHHNNARSDKHGNSSNHNHNHNNSNSNNNHNKSVNHNITINNVNTSRHKSNEISSTNASHSSSSSSSTSSSSRAENLIITLHRLAFYLSSKTALKPFAFHYQKRFKHDGWQYCDLMAEYKRQGLLSLPEWKVFNNSAFTLCDTYPPYVVLPSALSEVDVWTASAHRSKQRLPVITYRHSWRPEMESTKNSLKKDEEVEVELDIDVLEEEIETGKILLTDNKNVINSKGDKGGVRGEGGGGEGGVKKIGGLSGCPVLSRSAQPLVGLTLKSCTADEKLLNLYRLLGHNADTNESENGPIKFIILDARRQIAAALNMAAGKGTEDISLYPNAELIFCDIDNIHVMRASAQAMADLLLPGGHLDLNSRENSGGAGYYSKLEDSGWLKHTRLILKAGIFAAEKLHLEGVSVLVHCSDGWDRTAQICSVTQLLLDPFFRTLKGFAVLIEKEWCAFGFKFQDRSGQGVDHSQNAEERSPVFLQGLDCIYQILVQFPTAFEFSQNLLVFLADHVHSGLFGTFLGNSYRQRFQEMKVKENTQSIWSYVFDNKERFCNTAYTPYSRPIWPSYGMAKLVVWSRYFNRWGPDAHPSHNLGDEAEWHDDWGSGYETEKFTSGT